MKSLSRVRLLATPWTAAYQASLSMGFARQVRSPLFCLRWPPLFCHQRAWRIFAQMFWFLRRTLSSSPSSFTLTCLILLWRKTGCSLEGGGTAASSDKQRMLPSLFVWRERCQEGEAFLVPSIPTSQEIPAVSKSLEVPFGLNPTFHLSVLTQKLLQSYSEQLRGKFTILIPALVTFLLVHTSSHLWPHAHTPMSLLEISYAADLAQNPE